MKCWKIDVLEIAVLAKQQFIKSPPSDEEIMISNTEAIVLGKAL